MCGKICFDKKAAVTALNNAKHSRKRDKYRRECRYYFCETCNAYHLTSQEDRDENLDIQIQFEKQWEKLLK